MIQRTRKPLFLLVALFLWANFLPVRGQSERPRLTTSSPDKVEDAKNLLTEEELSGIKKQQGANNQIKTYVRFSEQRLRKVREFITQENYAASGEQLKGYTVLIADAGRVSKESIPTRDKAHKTLEIALREQMRFLEGIKFDLPLSYQEVVEVAIKTATQVRRQALNLLLGDNGLISDTSK